MRTAPDFGPVHASVSAGRGELRLERPDRLNALDVAALEGLIAAARWLDEHDGLKVVVVRGAGRAFSAGADVELFAGGADAGSARRAADLGWRMANAIEAMRAVTIASIHGHCVGGGVVLAAACDLRVTAAGTRFAIPEIKLGIPLGWGGIPRLVREVGPAITKELVMTGRAFDAEEAQRVGFVNQVVPAGVLDTAVDELAARLEAKARHALLSTKRHVNAVTEAMVGGVHSWADADGLLVALDDPEAQAAAADYLRRMADE